MRPQRGRNGTHAASELDKDRCLRWVKRRNTRSEQITSAVAPIADMRRPRRHVRVVPTTGSRIAANGISIRSLVGGSEQRRRDIDAKWLADLQVDSLHRQIVRSGALEFTIRRAAVNLWQKLSLSWHCPSISSMALSLLVNPLIAPAQPLR